MPVSTLRAFHHILLVVIIVAAVVQVLEAVRMVLEPVV